MIRALQVITFIFFRNALSEPRVDPLVHTKVGLIRGLKASDGDYSMFMGIPYATVDQANPFGAAIPNNTLGDDFKAFDDTAQCPQLDNDVAVGDIDCLYLNIYVPNTASFNNILPVMVWIYGGDFQRGAGGRARYGPKYLVRHDVIVVSINYRVGPYGFMCLDIPEVPGNQGLKDQILALRWIRDNIESFKGDVKKITIFGESAGARLIDFHLLSEQENIFSKAILQSGTAYNRDTIIESDVTAPLKIAEHLGFKTNDSLQAISFLASADSKLVISAASDVGLDLRPCVEKQFDGVERAISDYLVNLNYTRNIPMLIGYNNNEQVARYADKEPQYFQNLDVFRERLSGYFDFTENELTNMENLVRHFYIGEEEISQEVMWEIIDFDSDFSYNAAVERTVEKYLENTGREEVYYYVFSYVGNRNYYKDSRNVTVGGTSHGDDLGYLFDMKSFYLDVPTQEDQQIIDRMTTLWTNFAKYSSPTPEINELIPVAWAPVVKESRNYMEIGAEMQAKKRPFHSRMAFWELFFDMNWEKQKGLKNY